MQLKYNSNYFIVTSNIDHYFERSGFDTEKIYEDELDESYKVLHMQHDIIQQLYDRYPSEVLTLEKHFTHNPYKNRYEYEGDWKPQENLWLNQ